MNPVTRRAAVTMAIETIGHTLATTPKSEPERTIVISERWSCSTLHAGSLDERDVPI